MKNVLITGGAGFIGTNFIRYILQAEKEVNIVNLDSLTYAGNLENLADLPSADRYTFVQGDICDSELVNDLMRRYAIDTIVHFAAETHVDRSISSPAPFIQTNVVGTFTLLEAAKQAWLKNTLQPLDQCRFHHISTDEVFGSLTTDDLPFSETTPYAPNSPYSATKSASDHLVRAYAHTYGLPITITNCSNNYGPYQFPEKLIPLMVMNAIQGKPLPVYGDGQQVRDWLYVEDHCEAIHLILRKGKSGETYNIGGNNQSTNLELVDELCNILDELLPDSPHRPHSQLIKMVTDRPGHDRRYAMDITKIGAELGWKPRCDIKTGLRSTIEWYLSHREWEDAILRRPEYDQWLKKNYGGRGEKK